MIAIHKQYEPPPDILSYDKCKDEIESALRDKEQHNFKAFFNRKKNSITYTKIIREALNQIYHDKCAYCECNISAGGYNEIEHYRPIKGGYYWLAYEWSNLLLSCKKCNLPKSNQFPISQDGIRLLNPPENKKEWLADSESLRAENPLLLNPEVAAKQRIFIDAHLKFHNNGKIESLTDEGKTTIELCQLNREELELDRLKVIRNYVARIKRVIYRYLKSNSKQEFKRDIEEFILDLISDAFNQKNIFLQLRWQIIQYPELFFKEAFKNKKQYKSYNVFYDAVKNYKNQRNNKNA